MLARILVLCALVSTVGAEPLPLYPKVLFSDTFSAAIDPVLNRYGSDNGNFAYRIGYNAESVITGSLNRPSEGVAALSGVTGALKFASDGAELVGNTDNVAQVAAYFNRTSISIGESIHFSADLALNAKANSTSLAGINNMMRFGLVNMESSVTNNWNRTPADSSKTAVYEGTGSSTFLGTGFMANLQTGGSPASTRLNAAVRNRTLDNRLATNSAAWTSLTDANATWNTQSGNFLGGSYETALDLQLSQSIRRISQDVFQVTSTVSSDSWNDAFYHTYLFDAQGSGDAWSTFDTLFFTVNGGGTGIYRSLWDNISVTVVPEPSKILLSLIGVALLAFRRKRS